MDMKSIIALFMGLVIQLSQAQLSVVADSSRSCGTSGHAMSCCEGQKSCPCAKKSEPKERPAPLAPLSGNLKLFVSIASGLGCFESIHFSPIEAVFSSTPRLDSKSGYAGVPLSVAFCSFVI